METLVLKCKGTVNNSDLRGMNELRIGIKKSGDGSSYLKFGVLQTSNTTKMKLKVVSGSGYFVNRSDGTGNLGSEVEMYCNSTNLLPGFKASSDCEISIVNYGLIGTLFGNTNVPFSLTTTTTNCPVVLLNLKELEGKTCVSIRDSKGICPVGDVASFKKVQGLKGIFFALGTPSPACTQLTGNLSSLAGSGIEEIVFDTTHNFSVSLDDIAGMTSLYKAKLRMPADFVGGDLYTLLASKDGMDNFDLWIYNSQNVSAAPTCSYVSGTSSIPTLTIKQLSINNNLSAGQMDTANVKAFLTLLKDGIEANKITCIIDSSSSLRVNATTAAKNDSDVQSLVTWLNNNDCPFTFAN